MNILTVQKNKILDLFNFTFLSIPILGIFFFLLIFLLSTYTWIFTPNIFFGQNWDHQLTDNDNLAKNFFYNSFYVWHDNYGGNVLSQTQIILNTFIFLLNSLFSATVSNKLFLFLLLFFGFIINYKSLYFDYNAPIYKKINSVAFSIFYCFSPYFFNLIIGGSIYAWLSYLLFPTYFIYFYRYLELNLRQKIYFYLISFLFIGFLQFYLLANFFLLLYFFYFNKLSKKTALIFIKILVLQLVINLYWILPFLNDLDHQKNFFIDNIFFSYSFKNQSFFDAITMSGFFDRNFSIESLNNFKLIIFVFVSILIFTNLIRNIINSPNNYKFNFFLSIILLLAIFLSKKYNPPLGEFFYVINNMLPNFIQIFRSDQNLYMLVFFIYFYLNFKNISNNFYQGLLFIILIILLHSSGDYGSNILKSKNQSYISFTEKRHEFNELFDDINKNINGRFLIFPSTNSPRFYTIDGIFAGQGSIFEYNLFDNASTIYLNFEQKILILNKISQKDILLNNIKAFYLLKLIKYEHSPNIENYITNLEKIYNKIYNKTFENNFYIKFRVNSLPSYVFDYDELNQKILNKFEIKKINKTLYKSDPISEYKFSNLIFHPNYSPNWCIFIHSDKINYLSLNNIKSKFKCSKPFFTSLSNINSFKIINKDKTTKKVVIYLFNINQIVFYFSILLELIILFILFKRKKYFEK